MAKLINCPYCHGTHRKKSAFLKCQKKHEDWTYKKDGSVKKGK